MNKYILYIVIICLFSFFNGQLQAQSKRTLQKKEERLKQQIAETKSLIEKTKQNKETTLSQIAIIDQQITLRGQLIKNLSNQIKEIEENISKNGNEINKLNEELDKLKKEFKEMLRYAYKNRNKDYGIMYLLSADDINIAYRRIKYMNQYSESRKTHVKEIKETQNRLEEQNQELLKNKADKVILVEDSKKEFVSFEQDKTYKNELLSKIKTDQVSLQNKLKKQEEEKLRIARAIQKAIEEEIKKKKNATKNTSKGSTGFALTPEEKLLGKKFVDNKGKLPWPVEQGTVTGKFGKQQHSILSTVQIENNGIFISTPKNAKVRAVYDGEVTYVGTLEGAGIMVMISHGNYRTVYANLKNAYVKVGQKVATKQTIGELIAKNGENISESNFSIWKITGTDSQPVNPALWLSRR